MTALRSARSAWLLVGSTPGWGGERRERGPDLQEIAGEASALAVAGLGAGVFAHDRLEFATQCANAALELAALAGVLKDPPCPEQLGADPQAVLAELLVNAEPFGV
jgi:hypothetical protein